MRLCPSPQRSDGMQPREGRTRPGDEAGLAAGDDGLRPNGITTRSSLRVGEDHVLAVGGSPVNPAAPRTRSPRWRASQALLGRPIGPAPGRASARAVSRGTAGDVDAEAGVDLDLGEGVRSKGVLADPRERGDEGVVIEPHGELGLRR